MGRQVKQMSHMLLFFKFIHVLKQAVCTYFMVPEQAHGERSAPVSSGSQQILHVSVILFYFLCCVIFY